MDCKQNNNFLITGGNGLIGKSLSDKLSSVGFNVSNIGRTIDKNSKYPQYIWNIDKSEIEEKALHNVDYIIHLAGANIGDKRWTEKRKQDIIDSRVKSAELLLSTLKKINHKPKAIISASAIGYYGSEISDKIYEEDDPAGNDFLGLVCQKWESSVNRFEELGIRVVIIRTGIVLSARGGVLQKLLMPVKLGIGSPIGSGNQFMSWIHINDLCNIYLKAIEEDEMRGAYNAVAPEQITNRELVKILCHVLKKPFWFPAIPAFILKLLFGERVVLLINGNRVSSNKLRNSGFDFQFPDINSTLKALIT